MIATPLPVLSLAPSDVAVPERAPVLDHMIVSNPGDAVVFLSITDSSAAGDAVLDTVPLAAGFAGTIPCDLRFRASATARFVLSAQSDGTGAPGAPGAATARWSKA